jgi:hypothetical protein
MKRICLALGLCLGLTVCSGGRPSGTQDAQAPPASPDTRTSPAGRDGDAYVPATKRADSAPPAARGSIAGDFQWALGSADLRDAIARWQDFLARHTPKDGQYEDGFHARHMRAAELELLRAYYLAGRIEEGDALLHRLVDGSPAPKP